MFVLYLLGGVIVTIIMTMVFLSHLKRFKLTSRTPGKVVSATEHEVRDDRERRDETVVLCGYSVKGEPYELSKIFRGKKARLFPVGMELTIRYNPATPTMADIDLGNSII